MNALRILVVEDETLVARDLEATLTRMGFEVTALCRSGAEALAALRREQPDVILMDIHLPSGMDGVEAATCLQAEHPAPVIFLSGCSDEATLVRSRAAQPYGFLRKPFQESELRSAIELAHARHSALRQLQSREGRFISTLCSLAEGVISTDMLGIVNFMNPVAEQLTGWSAGEAVGRPLHSVFRVALPSGEVLDSAALVSGVPSRTILLTDREGRAVHIEDTTTPIRDAEGSLTGIVVLFRLAAEAARPRLPQRLSSLDEVLAGSPIPNLAGIVGSIADPLLALDADWRITYLNPLAAGVLGSRRESLLGQFFWDILPPSLHRLYYQEFSAALTQRSPASFEMEHEARGAWYGVQLYPFGQGLLVLMRDITVRKQGEQQQDKLEKLESLGLLARGFAHDFNNLLTVLLGNLALVELQLEAEAPARRELGAARRASLQAQNLVQQLLTFARGGAPIRQVVDVASLLRGWFAEWPRRPGLDYQLEVPPQLCPAEVDRHQIHRLWSNLLRNAEQAQPQGGAVSLRLTAASDQLVLEVADVGEGMDAETLSHIFEPYFTTRAESNASGLGLTVCESITKAHGGTMSVESRLGLGTVLRVSLPTAAVPEVVAGAAVGREVAGPRRARRVLVLEDEALILQLMASNLSAAGCEVTCTSEGSEAVARYSEALLGGVGFDLVVMDLSIPGGMGGAQAMAQLRQFDPGVRAIVSSGYSDDPVMSRYADFGFCAVLPKPYQPEELRALVLGLLAEDPRA